MTAAGSGQRRFDSMSLQAEALEAQSAQLAAKAASLRGAADKVGKGNEGEREVGALLDVLSGAGWHILHDPRKNRRSPANVDHVVVGPPGVLVIDTKNWSGGLLKVDARGMKLGGWRKDDALHSAKVDAELVRALTAQVVPNAPCVGVLAFVQDVGIVLPVRHRDVVLLQKPHLLPWLAELPRALSGQQVDELARHLGDKLSPRVPVASRAADSTVRPQAEWAPSAPRTPSKTAEKAAAKRVKARRELRAGLVRLGVVGLVLVTLPMTYPLAQQHVLTPLAERLASRLSETIQPPPAQPVPPLDPAAVPPA